MASHFPEKRNNTKTDKRDCISGFHPHLVERGLFERLRPPLHHGVQGLQHGKHALHVALPEVEARRLLQALVPHLVPQDGHADQLLAHLEQRDAPRKRSDLGAEGGKKV